VILHPFTGQPALICVPRTSGGDPFRRPPNPNPFDLTAVHVTFPDWYIFRLPEAFTDFFSEDFGGEEILQADQGVLLRCLYCGKLLSGNPDREPPEFFYRHASTCKSLAIAVLSRDAPLVLMSFPALELCRETTPLYVTAEGDDDIGLRTGEPLFLSHDRRKECIRQMLSGQLDELAA
jgi:hypothetical protein